MSSYIKHLNTRRVHLLIIILICVATYLPILGNSFAYDDSKFFKDWTTPRSFSNIGKFIEGDTPAGHEGVYRPMRTIFYAIDYKLWGGSPVAYHAQAILVNALMAVVVYFITAYITKRKETAFVAGLLFGILPVHTEGIAFTTASMDSIGLLFAFLSFCLYLTSEKSVRRLYLSLLCAFIAFFTYEVTLILPGLIYAYELSFKKSRFLWPRRKAFIWFVMLVAYYLLMRFTIGGAPSRIKNSAIYPYMLLSTFKMLYQYITAFIFPLRLRLYYQLTPFVNNYYAYKSDFLKMALIDNHFILTSVIIMSLAVLFLVTRKKHPPAAFGVLWFFAAMIPVVNLIPTSSIFAERYEFFATYGLILTITYFLTIQERYKNIRPLIIAGIVIFFVFCTIRRNVDWKNSIRLWTVEADSAPYSPVGWNNLGAEYNEGNTLNKAYGYFQKAIAADPRYSSTYSNLTRYYQLKKDYPKAVAAIDKAISLDPEDKDYIANKAILESQMNASRTQKRSAEAIAYTNRIRKEISGNNLKVAMSLSDDAATRFPYDLVIQNDAAVLNLNLKNYDKGIVYLKAALKIDPSDPDVYYNLANAYLAKNDKNNAKQALRFALAMSPKFQRAQSLLDSLK